MRLGCGIPSVGRLAGPENLMHAAQRAEALGYEAVWVPDRLLWPLRPRTPYPVTPDGAIPEYFKIALDPVEALTFVAAHTRRIGLGTSVLNMPFYQPVVLARRLATLDILSGGRLRVGLGQAWMEDEFEAVGANRRERAARADEFVRVLKAMWGPDPVEFQGQHFRVAPSIVGAKPVQRPHPPLYLAAYVPAALRRAATLADGWLPSGVSPDGLREMIAALRGFAREAGRDAARLEVIALTGVTVHPAAGGAKRGFLEGSAAEIREDVARLADLGVTELVAYVMPGTMEEYLAQLAAVREAVT
jgi:probable F420-dependent oxidoreductase